MEGLLPSRNPSNGVSQTLTLRGSLRLYIILPCLPNPVDVRGDVSRPNPTAKCFILADWWFWGPVCLSCAGLSSKLFMELARVKDSINMSKEIMIVAITWVVHAGEFVNRRAGTSSPATLGSAMILAYHWACAFRLLLDPDREHRDRGVVCSLTRLMRMNGFPRTKTPFLPVPSSL